MTRGRGVSKKSDRIDMAFQMNATFLKVLKVVLLGLPITEPNVKRGCRKIGRRLGTKRVSSRSRFALRCHAKSIRERERERGRKRGTSQTEKIERKERVCMHEKCMNMWRAKNNCIMGWTQSKPTSIQSSTFKHTLNAWNIVKMLMECNAWSHIIK